MFFYVTTLRVPGDKYYEGSVQKARLIYIMSPDFFLPLFTLIKA